MKNVVFRGRPKTVFRPGKTERKRSSTKATCQACKYYSSAENKCSYFKEWGKTAPVRNGLRYTKEGLCCPRPY